MFILGQAKYKYKNIGDKYKINLYNYNILYKYEYFGIF